MIMCVDIDKNLFYLGLKENSEGPQNFEIKGPNLGSKCEGPQKI